MLALFTQNEYFPRLNFELKVVSFEFYRVFKYIFLLLGSQDYLIFL